MTTPRDSLYDHRYHRYDSDRARGPSIMQELPPAGSSDAPRHAQFTHHDLVVRVDPLRADLNTEAARVAAALADKLRDVADRDDPVAARERDMLRRIGELEVEKRQLLDQVASAAKKIAEAKRLGLAVCARVEHVRECRKVMLNEDHSAGHIGAPGDEDDCDCGVFTIRTALEAL